MLAWPAMSARATVSLRRLLQVSLISAAILAPLFLPSQNTSPSAAPVDSRITRIVSDLEQERSISQTALSPDGRQIAWVVAEDGGTDIEVASTSNPAQSRRLSSGAAPNCVERNLAWSPDSEDLAFTSDCEGGFQPEIYVAAIANGPSPKISPPRRLIRLRGAVDGLAFSPDGQQIGFLYVQGATRKPGALDAMNPPSGVIGVDNLEVQRVASVRTASGELLEITPSDLHAYEFDWAPDSRRIAYIAAPPPGENNWWVAQLYTQALSDTQPRSIFNPSVSGRGNSPGPLDKMQIAVPRWSPDGGEIAFIGGLMSDQGVTGGDLYIVPSAGGEPRNITPGRKATPVWFRWMAARAVGKPENPSAPVSPHRRIELVEIKGGSMRRAVINLRGNDLPAEDSPDLQIDFPGTVGDGTLEGALSVSRDQTAFAYIQSSYTSPAAVMLTRENPGHKKTTIQITHINDSLRPTWGKAESMEWKDGNLNIQGWLLYPANYDPTKKYPLIVSVHGGPSGAVTPRWPGLGYEAAAFSPLGYFVFEPNPRGSFGQGEAFTLANRQDFGYGDLRDILAGVDAVSARLPIDLRRIGITGWSYGGFMTMFAVTQTHRFHAAVAGAGISDWQSYYGENSIDQWMIPFFGASVYDNPAVYAKSSAIDFIRNAKTPTLIVVGDRDGECPAPQSFEFWHALRAQHVPTRLVVYPGEGHGFSSPEHRRDVLERALSWFEQYMPAKQDDTVRSAR